MENPYRMTVKEANSQLSFAIAVLKGEYGKNWCKNVGLALIIKERLLKEGYPWQSRRVENWIHRLQARQRSCLQPQKADSERAEGPHSIMWDLVGNEGVLERLRLQPQKADSERAEEVPSSE
jgi:hypothetical protein